MQTLGVTRVIAGSAGGRRLAVPAGASTRPTSDRAREGLFGTVISEIGPLAGKRVLDLYAGSGAVGLEALSRGAREVLLVESDAKAAGVIRANITTVGIDGARVRHDRVERVLVRPPAVADDALAGARADAYDLVFADPPYAMTADAVTRVLTLLAAGWLADEALVVVERATRSGSLDWPPGFRPGKSRRYGEATFWYGWFGSGAVTGQTPADGAAASA
jgi:16S rRNA (guanine966-N2)-methyltransferase